ncbi:purine-cytosine permease-like transporter [Pseudomonas knackmussii B13]|uniref:Purine-cytosine permease-like transporter n=1 Tax=Pseudomonas knackmussii (strain DSM 6978 / CCUG 54928 / LMG 23759 / B13) TaxID=1301098 RepID=A0A024HJV9_PSEKB|nr:cytosine permease [Pseudomonas knackmussii]CDF85325.1 purine-cytosine permease-like transporter [Pseudomonas knackmussii B13]
MDNKKSHAITEIETFGVEQIPDNERNATPTDLFRMIFGGSNTFATAVLGSFPVLFGLSFQAGAWSIILGVLIGGLILAPMGLFGPLNGTNNAVSSGAHFGVHGRIVGSFLSLLTAIAFFSLSVWSSGDALIGGAKRLFDLPETDLTLGLAYGLFAVLVLVVCIYGFRFMLLVNKIAVWAASLLFLLGVFAFAGPFDANYAGTVQHGQAGFWAAFIGATLLAMSNPVSFGAFLGDWARYIPRETPKGRIMAAVIFSQIATLIPFFFGLVTATIVAVKAPDYIAQNNYVGGLLAIAPSWYFLPVCLIATIGGMSTGTTSLYGTGLDMSSVFPRLLNRVQATLFIGLLSIAFIFIGRFAANLVQSVSTFAVLIITCTSPWMVIMILGLVTRRGFYHADDLQVFTRGQEGGAYWFHNGWNWRGMGAWIPSALAGLCFVNLPGQFVGPLGNLAGGIDISLPVTLGLAALLYLTLLRTFPESAGVYGPQGPRWVGSHDRPVRGISEPAA